MPKISFTMLRETLRYLATGPAKGEQELILVMTDRVREIVPEDWFEVSSDSKVIRVVGVGQFKGKSTVIMPFFAWRTSLPADQRLEIIFRSLGNQLRGLLTQASGEPWPEADAEPHVSIANDQIRLWWGGASETEAKVKLRPIARGDLGV